ncbi:DNA primase [Flavobacteriales bacterium]|nr:DNA primase [Flavobacteriales bacterium]
MIPAQTVDLVMQTALIEEVVGDYVELKKSGSSFRGLSPFTNEKTPSFYVLPEKGIFKCFSSGKAGSVVTFLMELEKLSFPEAIKQLAQRYGIEIEEEEVTPEQHQARTERESLLALNSWAQKWLTDQMHETEEGKAIALSYFESRGFRKPVLDTFKIGYCPDSWDAMSQAALDAGYSKERLLALGLVKETDGKPRDFFKARVMFPIRDATGRTIAFGGRTLRSDKKIAKYFNSPESPLYRKGQVLFGLHLAKPSITKEDRVLLVEGYTDVMAMHQAGIENVVSSSGTALTVEQIKLIRRYTKNVTVLFDGDAAGIRASLRGTDLLLAEGLNVQVVLFPDGDDPDSFSKKVPSETLVRHIREEAKDFVAFKLELLAREAGDDPVLRSEMIHSIIESIAAIPDGIQQGVYLKLAAKELSMSEELLQLELNKIQRQRILDQQKAEKREAFRQRQGLASRTSSVAPASFQVPADWDENHPLGFEPGKAIEQDSLRAHRNVLEADLIRLVLLYSSESIQIESAVEEGDAEDGSSDKAGEDLTSVSFAEFASHHFEGLEMEFKHEACASIWAIYEAALDSDALPNLDTFLKHENPQLQSFVADAMIEKDKVSDRWGEVHQIYPAREIDQLKKALMDTLHHLKLNDNRYESRDLQEKMAGLEEAIANGEEAALVGLKELLERRKSLDLQKTKIASYFGVAILS